MAATLVVVVDLGQTGLMDLLAAEVAFPAADGVDVPNDGETYIALRNAGAGTHVITATTPRTVGEGLTVQDKTFSITAADWAILPPLDPNFFNNAAGRVNLTSDGTQTEMKVVAFKK